MASRLLTHKGMRLVLSLVVTACGTDVMEREPTPDAGALRDGLTIVADAVSIPPDGIPGHLTPCEEAVYHSDLAWIQSKVFDASCTSCHDSSSPAAGLTLLADRARGALVNVASTSFSGWTRVVPGNPAASMLMVQLGGEPGPELEQLMPPGQQPLCVEKVDAIRRWIAAGAIAN